MIYDKYRASTPGEIANNIAVANDGKSGFLRCVNFEQPRILIMSDKCFAESIANGTTRMASVTVERKRNQNDPFTNSMAMVPDDDEGVIGDSLSKDEIPYVQDDSILQVPLYNRLKAPRSTH